MSIRPGKQGHVAEVDLGRISRHAQRDSLRRCGCPRRPPLRANGPRRRRRRPSVAPDSDSRSSVTGTEVIGSASSPGVAAPESGTRGCFQHSTGNDTMIIEYNRCIRFSTSSGMSSSGNLSQKRDRLLGTRSDRVVEGLHLGHRTGQPLRVPLRLTWPGHHAENCSRSANSVGSMAVMESHPCRLALVLVHPRRRLLVQVADEHLLVAQQELVDRTATRPSSGWLRACWRPAARTP